MASDSLDGLAPTAPQSGRDSSDAAAIAERVRRGGDSWQVPRGAVELGGIAWTPALVNLDKKRILHVHLAQRVPRYIAARIQAADRCGFEVHVACHVADLYSAEFLRSLVSLEAYVYVIDDRHCPDKRRHILAAMADLNVPVSIDDRKLLAREVWQKRELGSSNSKGRRLEALLAFILSRVGDFRIFERNFRNETQEIDIVLQVESNGARSWHHQGAAFILVESKNTTDPIGQPPISLMFRKLETKRGSAKIAMFFSVGGYTADAEKEELRSSTTEYCVAMFESVDIENAIEADDIAEFLENKVSRALLR